MSVFSNPIDENASILANYAQANPLVLNEELSSDSTTGFYKKLINTNLSAKTKLDMVQEKALEKNLNINDYRVGTLKGLLGHHSKANLYAEDDPFFNAEEGNPVLLDSFYKTRERISNSIAEWDLQVNQKYQDPDLLANLLQKPRELLTEEDTKSPLVQQSIDADKQNYRNYWDNVVYDSLSKHDFKFEQFDPKKTYAPVDSSKDIPVGYRVLGENSNLYELGLHKYNGQTQTVHNIEAINLKTGNDIYFDLAKIPLFNEKVDIYGTLDTPANRIKQRKYNESVTGLNELVYDPTLSLRNNMQYLSDMDTDGRFGEFVDLFKSQGLRSFARFMKQNTPEGYEKFWDKYANSKTGQLWSDLLAGVSQKTRDEFSEAGTQIADYIVKGDIASASDLIIHNLDRFTAESLPQMGSMILTSMATKKMPVDGITQKIVKAAVTALPVALDKTYSDIEDFKVNNKRDMSSYERTRTFIGALATSIPEALILGMFEKTSKPFRALVGKVLSKTSEEVAVKTGKELLKDIGKTTIKAAGGEAGQEYAETTWDTASSANQQSKSFLENLKEASTDKETLAAAGIGFYMGGATAGAIHGLNTAANLPNTLQQNKQIRETISKATTYSATGEKADQAISASTEEKADQIRSTITSKSSADDKLVASAQLQHLVDKEKSKLSIKARNDLLVQKAAWDKEAITSYLQEGLSKDEIEKKIGTNIEKAMASQLWFSHVNPMNSLLKGKRDTTDTVDKAKEEARALGKKLGLSEDFTEQLIDEISTGIRSTEETHLDTISDLEDTINTLKTKKLSPDEKKSLNTKLSEGLNTLATQFLAKAEIVQAINDAMPDLARPGNVTETTASARGGKLNYKILADDIASNTLEKGTGTYRIVRNLLNDMRDIADAMSNYKSQSNIAGAIANTIDSNGNINTNAIDGLESQFKNLTNNVRTKVMNEQAKFQEEMSKDRPRFVNTLAGQLEWLSKNPTATSNRNYGMFTQNLNAAINTDPTIVNDLKAAIDSRTKFSEQGKKNMQAALDKIIDFNNTIKADRETSLKERERGLTNLDKLLKENTLEKIRENTIDEARDSTETKQKKLNTLTNLLAAFTAVQRHFHTISDTSPEDIKRGKELTERRNEILALRGNARTSLTFSKQQEALSTTRKIKSEDLTQDTNAYIDKLPRIKSNKQLDKNLTEIQKEFASALASKNVKAANNAIAKWQATVSRMEELGFKLPRVVSEMKEKLAKQKAEEQAKTSKNAQTPEKGPESPSKASEASVQENIHGKPADASETPSNAQNGHMEGKAQEQSQTEAEDKALRDFTEKYREGLRKAGMTDEQAEAVVTLLEANAKVMSSMFGLTPKEYLEKSLEGYEKIKLNDFDNLSDEAYAELFTTSLYQQDKNNNVKGAFSIGTKSGKYKGKAIVQIFENGDVSTALHETSHYFLESIRAALRKGVAPDWLKNAWSKLEKTYGFSGLLEKEEEWDEYDRVHERFARDFEAYMREGKAPKKELQTIFDKCKQWLTEIYKSIKSLLGNDKLSPEIREVFDALLTKENTSKPSAQATSTNTVTQPSTTPITRTSDGDVYLSDQVIANTRKANLTRLNSLKENYDKKIADYESRINSLNDDEYNDYLFSKKHLAFIEEEIARKSGEYSDERISELKEQAKAPSTPTEANDAVAARAKNTFQSKQAERLGIKQEERTSNADNEEALANSDESPNQKKEEAPASSQTKLLLDSERLIFKIQERYKKGEVRSDESDYLDPTDQVRAGMPDCMVTLDPSLYFNTHILGATTRHQDFLRMLDEMQFSPHAIHMTTTGEDIPDPMAYITTRQKEEGLSQSSMIGNAPHWLFLYDVDPDHPLQPKNRKENKGKNIATNLAYWKPNRLTFMIVDYSLREFFGTTSYEQYFAYGKLPHKDEIASMFGLSADKLSFEELEQLQGLIKQHGIPRSMLAEMIGRLIVKNLGLKEKFETSNLDYYEKLVAGFGSFALDWGAKQGLYNFTTFDVDAWYLDNLSAIMSGESLVDVKRSEANKNYNQLTDYLNKLDLNEEQQSRRTNLLRVLDNALSAVNKDNKTVVNNKHVAVFDEKIVKAIVRYIEKGDTGHVLNNSIDCIKVNPEQTEKLQYIKTEFRGSLDEKTGRIRDDGLVQLKTPKSRSSAQPRWDKPTVYSLYSTAVRNTGGKVLASPFRVLAMQELSNCAYQVDTDAIEFLNEEITDPKDPTKKIKLWDTVGRLHGWQTQEDIDKLSYSGQLSAEGVNVSIQNDIAYIRDALATQTDMIKEGTFKGMFFDFFLARNGRINNASTTINQQSSKLARFMVLPRGVWRVFNPKDEKQIAFENYAITQAFDLQGSDKEELTKNAEKLKSFSKEKLLRLRYLLCTNTTDQFKQATKEEFDIEIGVENFAQCLNALSHLLKRAEANGESFTTSLAVENDSTTSGYANKALNMPYEETLTTTDKGEQSTIASKVGIHIIPKDKVGTVTQATITAHESKKFLPSVLLEDAEAKVKNLDMYRTVALEVSNELSKCVDKDGNVTNAKKLGEIFAKSLAPSFGKQSGSMDKAIKELIDIFRIMSPALPKAVEGEVSTELRTMMKDPTMVFIYSAGVNTMAKNVANKIMEDFLSTYVAAKTQKNYVPTDKDKASYDAIMKTIDKIATNFVPDQNNPTETFIEALKTRPYSSIRVNQAGRHITLDTLFNRLIGSTYGQPAAETLKNLFENFVKANDDFIQMTSMMFELYNEVYTEELATLRTTKGIVTKNEIKSAAVREMEERISGMLPYITLPDNIHRAGKDNSKLLMIKSAKSMNKTNKAQNYLLDKNGQLIQGTSAYGASRVPDSPGRSGAVLGIHGIDGHIISMIAAKYAREGIAVIHDAYVSSAFVHEEISHDYNQFLAAVNLNYNLYGNVLENFKRVYNNYIDYRVNQTLQADFDPNAYSDKQTMREARRRFKAEARENIESALRDRAVKGGNKEIIYVTRNVPLTLGTLLDNCIEANQKVLEAKDWLSKQYFMVTNMDSARPEGAALITPDSVFSYEQSFHNIVNDARNWTTADMHGSHPDGFISSGMLHTIYEQALNDTEARVQSLSYLREVSRAKGERDVSDEHFSYLQDIIRSIAYDKNMNTILELADNGLYTAGQVEISNNSSKISIALGSKDNGIVLDPITGLSACSYMSPVEIVAHEMMHIANDYAFKHRNDFRINHLINKLLRNREEAAKIITPEDFMPPEGFYDKSLEDTYRKIAEDRWHYYFDNDNSENLESLNEYCAFIATNEEVRNRLKNKYPEGTNKYKDLSFLDKLIKIAKDIYDVVFGPKTFKEAYNHAYEVLKGNASIRQRSLLEDFDTLTAKMRAVQFKTRNRLLEHPMRWVECLFSIAGQAIHWGDKHLHDLLYKAFNYSDLHGGPRYDLIESIPLYATTGQKLKESAQIAKYFFTSGEQRRLAKTIFTDTMKMHQQGIFLSTMRDFFAPDEDTAMLESLGLRLRSVDRSSKGLESATFNELKEAFGKELNDFENTALTNCALYTDLQCCMDYGLSTIRKWLADNDTIDTEIDKLKKSLVGGYNKNQLNWIYNQINNLASFMVYHVGNPGMNYNAENIVKGLGYQGTIKINEDHTDTIDKLITLTALRHTDQRYRDVVNTLNDKGLNNFLHTHKNFVDESKNGIKIDYEEGNDTRYSFMNPSHVIKGYTKQLLDPNLELQVAVTDPTDPNKLYNQGYKLIQSLKPNAVTNRSGVGLYTRFGLPLHTDGAIVSLQGSKTLGQSLRKLAWQMSDQYPEVIPDSSKLFTVYRTEGDKQFIAINKLMANKELSFEDCAKLHEKYSDYIPQPSISADTMPSDYNITVPRELKRSQLGLDERALTILSKMYGSVTRQVNGTLANNVLLQFLRQQENNIVKNHTDKNGNRYIKLEENSPNKYLQKMWKAVPQSFKDDIEANGDLWVREDWLQDLFGVQNYTLNNAKWVQKIPSHWLKRCIALAEMIMKTVAYYRKQNIVIRIPGVLLGNIISNIAYSILNHKNPLKVFKHTLANAQAIRDYLDTKKEQNRILLKRRLGTATEAEVAKANRLQDRLNNNIVAPLMKKGMYQAIVEDLNPDELESIGLINKFVKKNKAMQKLPNALKWTAKQLYMTEGTPIYDFMFTATQYSDFIARATEYQLCMEKVPAEYNDAVKEGTLQLNKKTKKLETKEEFTKRREREISTAITNAFINYDKPQSQAEQYLNDLGVLMFTKFAKRIQHVIGRQLYYKPVSAILFLLSQHFLVDTEDILEQNVFSKHWSALVHNPIENFLNTVVPMPIQFIFGDQKVL